MNMTNYDRKALKERARASLRGIQPRPWKVTLVYLLVTVILPLVVSGVLMAVFGGGLMSALIEIGMWEGDPRYLSQWQMAYVFRNVVGPMLILALVGGLLSILLSLLQALMRYGYARYGLKLYRGEPTAVKDAFAGFSKAGRVLGAAILTGIFTFLWTLAVIALGVCAMLISMVLSYALFPLGAVLQMLAMMAVYVGMLVCVVVVRYRYSLVPYFIMTTDMGPMDAIRASKDAMRGNMDRRFMLDLSFMGWWALEFLIMYIVMYVGMIVTFVALAFGLAMSEGTVNYNDAAVISSWMAQFCGGFLLSFLLGALASIPLALWLTPYWSAAEAGFFLAVTGQDGAPAAPTGFPPRPATGSVWDSVPTAPGFTTPPVIPPAPPAPPIPPVPTWGSAGPGPNDPIPTAPAAPEAPVETPPETPAVPEPPVETAPEAPAEPETPREES